MRKLLILCFLCFTWIARGQDEYRWHYWFDANYDAVVSGTTQSRLFTIDADASNLDFGAHTFNIQVEGKDGISSSPVSKYFYYSNSTIDKLTYWFDNDTQSMKEVSGKDGHFILDVSDIEPGIHFINLMLKDASGRISEIKQECFYRVINKTATKLTYWFDDDESTKETIAFHDGTSMFDVSKLKEGFHTISIVTHDYTSSAIATRMFIKVPQTQGGDFDMVCLCSVDGKLVAQDRLPSTGGILNFNLDVNNIDPGLHKALFQTITPTGAASNTVERYFIRTTTDNEIATMKCLYSIDDAKTYTQAGNFANGLFHFDLDVTSLTDGLHRLAYMLIADNGVSTPMQSAFFWKTPVGGNAITQYEYWLNGNSDEVHSVTLDEPKDPFQLIKLLPVTAEPIRTSCFHFENKDNQPKIYAKNDIHFRFHDKSGRWVDADRQYVDYNISEKVVVDKMLTEVFGKETFSSPKDGEIKWYAMECKKGDSIAVKSSQAASIQVFTPSGKEVYNKSGAESVTFGGLHTWEDGTYYVAIHDVTGSSADMKLDYLHISKYAVLSHTPTVQGNIMASFEIDLFGNGYDKLQSAKLVMGNQELVADSVYVVDVSNSSLYFTIDDEVPNGDYNLVLTFIDDAEKDSIVIIDALTIEEPQFADIKVSVDHKYSSTNPVTMEITVTNPGNTAYSLVPFNIAWDKIDNISKIEFKNFWISMPEDADSLGYRNIVATNNLLGKKVKGGMMFLFIPTLKPKETKKFLLDISFIKPAVSSAFYAWTSTPLELDTVYQQKYKDRAKKAFNGELASNILTPGDYYDVADKAAYVFNIKVPQPLGYALDISDKAVTIGVALAGISEGVDHAVDMAYIDAYGIDPDSDLGQQIKNLHGQGLLTPLDLFGGPVEDFIAGLLGIHDQCAQQPHPDPTGVGAAAHYIAVDPNDIYGYRSDSGSKFISDSLLNVFYRIEFENDTALASASAHTIEVKDTLDGKYFDLSTFAPTSVKIGNKTEYLDGTPNFVKTIDMRPEIYAIAQVEGKYDKEKGIATWTFTSLDPMTMEPTDDIMQGILPINYDGVSGIGEVSYDISLKQQYPDGTIIKNKASIVFDSNDPIVTPIWTNTVDAVCPESHVTDIVQKNDTIASVYFEGEDNRSGIWKYDVYIQYGQGSSWVKYAECGADSSYVDFRYYDGLDYGFCVLATDSAGNVEQKELTREIGFSTVVVGDPNSDGYIDIGDYTTIANYILGTISNTFVEKAADVNGDTFIDVGDLTAEANLILYGGNAVQAKPRYATEDEALIFINDTTMTAGEEVVLSVKMKNGVPMTGFQFDVVMPEGLSIAMDEDGYYLIDLSTERTTTRNTNTFDSALQTDGSVRVLAGSTKSKTFEGTDGEVCTITVKAAEGIADGTYTVVLKNIVMSDATGKTYKVDRSEAIITIGTTTGINAVGTKSANGKYLKDNKVTIIRNGKKYTAVGVEE